MTHDEYCIAVEAFKRDAEKTRPPRIKRINADRDAEFGSAGTLRFLCSSAFQRFCCWCVFVRVSVVIFSSPVNQRRQSGVAKVPAILFLLAVAIFAAGALRYYRHGNFTLAQAGYCLVAILASLAVLLVFDYTLHHAKIVAVMVLVFVVLFLVASPAFCVGMGLGLTGMVVSQGKRR